MKKPKFFLIPPLILALCVILCAVALAASDTPEIVASGECGADGDNVTWTLDGDGTLTISGTGDMKNYDVWVSNYSAPWYAHRNNIYRVIINDGITCIGSAAFQYCSNLVDVNIPESVSSIHDHAFYHCTSLTKISIPGSVYNLADSAFLYCTSLVDVTICDGVGVIGRNAFDDCEKLEVSILLARAHLITVPVCE